MNPVAIAFLVALGLSLAGNATLSYLYVGAREEVATAEADLTTVRGQAKQCSDGVADLMKRAKDAEKEAKQAREVAKAARVARNRIADSILTAPPTTPGNDCKSADDRFNNWLGAK